MTERKRRFLDPSALPSSLRHSPIPTVIGRDTVIIGDVRGNGQFVVLGEVRGDGQLEGALHLAVSASWYGAVKAHDAIIAGKIMGSLSVDDKLEIGHTAVIHGRVSARSIAIAKGAVVDGEIEVTGGTPVVEFEEKRALHEP
jgi:cytoskeletal protein CcmA (bactofilin family)